MIDATSYRDEQEETNILAPQDAHSVNYEGRRQTNYETLRDSDERRDLGHHSSESESTYHTEVDLYAELDSTRQTLAQKEQEAALAAKLGHMLLEANKQLTADNKDMQEKLEVQTNENKLIKEKMGQLDRELHEATSAINFAENQMKASDTMNQKLANQVAFLEEQLNKYKASLRDYDYISKRNKDLTDQVKHLEEELKSIQEQSTDLKKKLKQAETDKATLKQSLTSIQESMTTLQEEIRRLEAQRDREIVIAASVKELQSQIFMLSEQNAELRKQLDDREEIIREREILRMENERLQSEREQDQRLLLYSREEIDQLKNREMVPTQFVSQSSVKGSLLDELEEQVAKRVEEELRSVAKTPVLEPFTEQELEKSPSQENSPWGNFLTYLPLLKSANSTRELVATMSLQELQKFNSTLSKVVNAYSGRLVEVLEEREDIRSEREFRVVLIKQLIDRQKQDDRGKTRKKLFSSPFK